MRVVLDTNVVASGFVFGGHPETILLAWALAKIEVFASPEILWEYEATLHKLSKKNPTDVQQWLLFLHDRLNLTAPNRQVVLCRDPDDDKFLSCAVSAKADFIISGDKDLLTLKTCEGIPILKPAEFLKTHPALLK